MRKRRIYLVLLLLGVGMLVGVLLVGAFREREPAYGGRKLSGWMEVLSRVNSDTRDPLKEAFGQMGPATIPYLLKWLRGKEPPAWKKRFRDAFNAVAKRVHPRWVLTEKGSLTSLNAAFAFQILGEKGKGAIPFLIQLIDDPQTPPEIAARATRILRYLGPEAVAALTLQLANRDALVRSFAASGLQTLGTNARSAVPALVQCLKDENFTVRWEATNTLRHIEPKALVGSE